MSVNCSFVCRVPRPVLSLGNLDAAGTGPSQLTSELSHLGALDLRQETEPS